MARAQGAVVDVFVAPETDVADLDLRAFLDHEGDGDGGGRDGTDFGADGGELTAVFGEQSFQDDFGFLDFGGVVLALDRQPDLAVLEAVEHVAGGDRVESGVVDFADRGPLFDVDVNDPALGALLALEADVLEITGVPEGVEVPLDGGGVVDVADFGEDAGFDGVGGNAAVAVDHDANDEVLLGGDGSNHERQSEQNEEAIPDGAVPPNTCSGRSWSPRGVSKRAHVAAGTRRAHRNSMMTAMNRNHLKNQS